MTATDITAALDAEETRLLTQLAEVRSAKATLRRLLGLTEPPHGPTEFVAEIREAAPSPPTPAPAPTVAPAPAAPVAETEPGKPDARPATPTAGGWAERMAAAIAGHGPQRAGQLAALLGWTAATVSGRLTSRPDLFRKQPGNLLAAWELTEAGRAAAGTA